MKTTARNQFRGTVKAVHNGAVYSDVVLDIGEGVEIVANITKEAVDDLRLVPGQEAIALIKSSFVILTTDTNIRVSARNRLKGTVTEVLRGAVNSEVKLLLVGSSGRILTSILTNESVTELKIAQGTPCVALIKASHVLIAVND